MFTFRSIQLSGDDIEVSINKSEHLTLNSFMERMNKNNSDLDRLFGLIPIGKSTNLGVITGITTSIIVFIWLQSNSVETIW